MKRSNLWAPWRIKYIKAIDEKGGCFICRYLQNPQSDDDNFVLWRTERSVVIFNRFPYNNGHLLIAPARHIPDFDQTSDEEMLELTKLIRSAQKALTLTVGPHGFNIGANFGRCAGAGLPGHLHIHVVPRWDGDTNYMHVCGDTDVISQSITELYQQMKQTSIEHNLPGL